MTLAARTVDRHRRAMLAKVHLAAKELGLNEDARRDVLERVTGARSAGACSDAQLATVLDEFKRLGWKPAARQTFEGPTKAVRRPADSPVATKARALWLSLWQLGVVRSPDDAALEAFARRQLGVAALQWADAGKAYRLIEALKAMAEREGWSQSPQEWEDRSEVFTLKAGLLRAQWAKLGRVGEVKWDSETSCIRWLCRERTCRLVGGLYYFTEAELDASIAHLGEWIRRAG